MYSLRYLRRQVDTLQRRLKPVLAVLRLRRLALDFCDEYDETVSREGSGARHVLSGMIMMFMPRVGQAGFRLDTFQDLDNYLFRCLDSLACPEPREIVFALLPWAAKGPLLRPDLWERPSAS